MSEAFCQVVDSSKTAPAADSSLTQPSPISGNYYASRPFDTAHTQNPTAALFKSMFVPGWGQLGNHKYLKAGIFIGIEGLMLTRILHYAKVTNDRRALFDAAPPDADREGLFNLYMSAKDDRNLFTWFLGATVFLSMFDAYVDAHLAHFPKYDRKFTLDIGPVKNSDWGALVTMRF